MNRVVEGEDGRQWMIRAQMEWRSPATVDDFEHDVAGNYAPGIAMLILTVVLAILLLSWMPADVRVPTWVPLVILLVALFFPLRWVLRRPWTIVAETSGHEPTDKASERWVGTVRGALNARGEMTRVAKSIEQYTLPDFDGPLRPVE